MKTGAKIIKKTNTNKLNYEIMKKRTLNLNEVNDLGLKRKFITQVDTQYGYLQVIEYELQDYSYIHIVQYHFNNELEMKTLIPKMHCKSFYKDKIAAMKFAHNIGNQLLENQY